VKKLNPISVEYCACAVIHLTGAAASNQHCGHSIVRPIRSGLTYKSRYATLLNEQCACISHIR